MGLYVQYGCGLSAPQDWLNFDASPTLRLQKIPLAGKLIRKTIFPPAVRYGDIVKGLPGIQPGSCAGVYCSHVLEHLALEDFRIALKNSLALLKPGGIFRCVVPDLEANIDDYNNARKEGDSGAATSFLYNTMLGIYSRPQGLKNKIIAFFGNSHHLWMWDRYSLEKELRDAGFSSVRACKFNDSADKNFEKVEEADRFRSAVAFEAIK